VRDFIDLFGRESRVKIFHRYSIPD
jgi:hypothetical protein